MEPDLGLRGTLGYQANVDRLMKERGGAYGAPNCLRIESCAAAGRCVMGGACETPASVLEETAQAAPEPDFSPFDENAVQEAMDEASWYGDPGSTTNIQAMIMAALKAALSKA